MSANPSKTLRPQPANASASRGMLQSGNDDSAIFNLRDTLNSISVREAGFGEFLAALKQRGQALART